MQSCFVVDCYLFPRFDVAQGEEENMVVKDLHERVRTARVVDVMRSVSTTTPVETPPAIHLADS